jgi:DNA replication and repair protein RecF
MHLKHLSILQFKNCGIAELTFSKQVNCFTGDNGEGKTNILDAIYYLSFTKSFFNPNDSQNIKRESDFFMIKGDYERLDENETVQCAVKRGQKKSLKRNKKEYTKLADHIGLFPLVMISPSDAELITEGSEMRRKFIDGVISQYHHEYLDLLLKYNNLIIQRNNLLKNFAKSNRFDATAIEVYNEQLIAPATKIYQERALFLKEFIPLFQNHYNFISNKKEKVNIQYVSHLSENNYDELLQSSISKDRAVQHTTTGIHKDELMFEIDDFPVKKFASQGQQKSFVIALKLAQFELISNKTNLKPITLLDDIFDKLDQTRVKSLLQLISDDKFGQIFITHTDIKSLKNITKNIKAEQQYFVVKKGEINHA